MIHLTKDTIGDYISGDTPVLIDFYADWCAPCVNLLKIIHRLEDPLKDRVIFTKVDIVAEPELKEEYGVTTVPAFFLIQKNTILKQWVGVRSISEMRGMIENHLE